MATFQESCRERIISLLREYFPEAANDLAAGKKKPAIHSPNGWATLVLGGIIDAAWFEVSELDANPDNPAVPWLAVLGMADAVNRELAAWGRPCKPRAEVERAEKAWMRALPSCPEKLQSEVILWWGRGDGIRKMVSPYPTWADEAPAMIERLKIGTSGVSFWTEEVA